MDLLSWRVFQTCDFLNIIYEIQDLFYFYKSCLFNDKLKDIPCFLLIHKRNLKIFFKNSYNTPVISNKYFLSNYIIFLHHTFSILSHIHTKIECFYCSPKLVKYLLCYIELLDIRSVKYRIRICKKNILF